MTGPLYNVALAQRINQAHGGAVISAWEVDQLDEATYKLFEQWVRQGPHNPAGAQAIEDVKAQVRRQFRH